MTQQTRESLVARYALPPEEIEARSVDWNIIFSLRIAALLYRRRADMQLPPLQAPALARTPLLGMAIADFPNLFMIHGPGSPSVLYNMPLGAERETEWIGNCVRYLREKGLGAIEPTLDSEKIWDKEVTELANETLYPLTDSWYTGANIPGKLRQFKVHLGGPLYFERLSEVAAKGYEGFVFEEERVAEVSAAS